MKFRRTESESTREIPDALIETLNQLDEEAIILAPGEVPIFATDGAEVLGILRDGKVQSTELIALICVVRRTNTFLGTLTFFLRLRDDPNKLNIFVF